MVILPLILFLSILFIRLTHPLSAGVTLLIQTSLIALASGLFSKSFWFSYILFLIFLGGMLVLFIYVASLASNETFKSSSFLTGLIVAASILAALIILVTDPILIMNFIKTSMATHIFNHQTSSAPFLILQIYNFPSTFMTTFIILYLLLTLLAVVKVTSVFFGPLRISK